MKRLLTLLAAFFLGSASLPASTPEADAIIAKARAAIGGDAALDAVNSLHLFGSIEMTETPAGAEPPEKSKIEIIFQKPCHHRLVVTSAKSIDITGLDDYFAWRRVETEGARARNIPMEFDQTRRLRANTWENLYFFHGVSQGRGEIVDQGETVLDGVKARKIAFRYGPGIEFTRYFNIATGRLLLTETTVVGKIREEGEIKAGGVLFPRKIVISSPEAVDGKLREITLTFDRVLVNETFPASTFEQPLFSSR